jgi:hypothetical protein
MAMKFKATIRKSDGKIVTEVLDRSQGSLCSEIYKVTNAVGRQESDEHIGPECDTVQEVVK